jgi:replicative DNA helicase
MSVGLQFLYGVCTQQASAEFRRVRIEWFSEQGEGDAYQFVRAHYNRYNQLPTPDTCRINGHALVPATEPVSYYETRLRARFAYTHVQAGLPTFQAALARRDIAQMHEFMRNGARSLDLASATRDTAPLYELSEEVLRDYQHAHSHPGRQGITLGWPLLDTYTNGAEGGDVITIVARPNKGKSWLLTHMARAAWLANASVLFVTMEMTGKQIARRMLGFDAGINPNYIREGRLSEFGYGAVVETHERFQTAAPFHIMTGSFDKSTAAVDAGIQEFSPDIVYIDASYLMKPERSGNKKAHELLAEVGTEIKQIALSRNKPIAQTVQFNRSAEQAEERTLAHIGGTDVVGQISTIVIGVDDGEMPSPSTSRALSLMKNRENELVRWNTRFLFNPPNFNYLPPEDIAPEENGGVEAEWTI